MLNFYRNNLCFYSISPPMKLLLKSCQNQTVTLYMDIRLVSSGYSDNEADSKIDEI